MTLQDELRRRRELRLPPLSAEEQRQFQQNLTDTAGRDLREAGRGTVKTSMKGTKVLDGQYKGLTKPQMEQAIITGAPVPTGKSGYVRGGPLTGGPGLPQRAPSAAQALPEGGRMVPGRSTGSQVYVPPGQKAWFEQAPSTDSAAPTPAAIGPVTQSLSTVPASSARPPQAAAANTVTQSLINVPSLASPSPRPQGLINGQPASQFFQEAANRQGVANSYGTIKPQIATPAPAPSAAPAPAGGAPMLAGPPSVLAIPDLAQGPPKAARGAAPTPAAVSTPNNMTPAGRLAIINAGAASLKPPAAPGPLTQVGGGSAPGAYAAAQKRLDQSAADGAIVGMTTDGMKLATGAVNAGVNAIAGTASAVGGIGAPLSKVGTALSKTLFGDPAARARLQKPPGPSAMPPVRPAKTLQPSQVVMSR